MQYITIKTYVMKALLTALMLFLSLTNSYSTNYYIATTGSSLNNGTSASTPKATLATIFSSFILAAGDTVFVAAGTYAEKTIIVGSNDKGFVIEGAPLSGGIPTTIFSSDQTSYWMRINNAACDNITLSKIKIANYKESGSLQGGGLEVTVDGVTGLKVKNCVFDNCDAKAGYNGGSIYFLAGSTNTTLELTDVVVTNSNNTGAVAGAVYIYASGFADIDVTMTRCKFYSNSTTGDGSAIMMAGDVGSSLTMTSCLLYNNSITATSHNGVIYTNTKSTLTMTNCTVYGNTASTAGSNTETGGIYVNYTANIKNSILYANTYKDIFEANGTTTVTNSDYQGQYNTTLTNCITSNPQFTNAAAGDFTLLSTSPCINAGTDSGAPLTDASGSSREGTADIGAFEYITPTAMPIVLLSFEARYEDGKIHTKWITASETNVDYYAVEYSKNAVDFTELCRLKSIGNSREIKTHECTVAFLEKSDVVYIRLKEVDYDGYVEYFKIIGIVIELKTKTIIGIYNLRGNEASIDDAGLLIVKYSDGSFQKIVKR